jgi:hypothetical protein
MDAKYTSQKIKDGPEGLMDNCFQNFKRCCHFIFG